MTTSGSHDQSLFAGLSLEDDAARVVVVASTVAPSPGGPAIPANSGDLGEPTELLVIDAAEVELPGGVVVEGRVRDNPSLGIQLGQLWRELSLGGVPTFLGLQPADSWVRVLSVATWPESAAPVEVASHVGAMRTLYGADPAWSMAPVGEGGTTAGQFPLARVVGCRREDLSAATWAARRSGIWVAGIKLTATALAGVAQQPETGGLVWFENFGDGSAIVTVLGGRPTPGVHAVGRVHHPALAGDGASVLTMLVDEAGLASWTAALDPTHPVAAVRNRDHLGALLADARFDTPVLDGAAKVLAAKSPLPVDRCAGALGLALAAAGVGPKTDDLRRSLLQGGLATIQSRCSPARPTATEDRHTGAVGAALAEVLEVLEVLEVSAVADVEAGTPERIDRKAILPASLFPPSPADRAVVRSVGLLNGGTLERSRDMAREGALSRRAAAAVAVTHGPLGEALGLAGLTPPHRRAPVWVHRAGLFRGQPHVGVLDGDHLELRGAVTHAIVAQQIRRSAARLFAAGAVTGELCIHPDADPGAVNGVRWERRLSFDPGASELLVRHDDVLDELLDLLEDHPWISVVIEGHSDDEGDLADNLRLSRGRAQAVAEVLVAEGCDVARVAVRGRGPFCPLAWGDSPDIRELHRRVDVTFMGLLA